MILYSACSLFTPTLFLFLGPGVPYSSADGCLGAAFFRELQGKKRKHYVEKQKHMNSCP